MAKITCPHCRARVSLPKRTRPLSGPGPGRAYESPLCPSCDADLSEQIAEYHALRKRRRLGVFAKAMAICAALCVLTLIATFVLLTLQAPRFYNMDIPWAEKAERALMIITQILLALGLLLKILYQVFEER